MIASDRQVLEQLLQIVGEDGVETSPDQRRYFAEDALRGRGGIESGAELPLAVVRPPNAEAVAGLLAFCSDTDIAVVAYGAGTGLMGGARSTRPVPAP